jgi:carbon-monoxide dehydrogenase large subunit
VTGAGEAGAIGSCPAVMNAVADALWRGYRIRHVDMPATPERLWAAIAEGRRVHNDDAGCSRNREGRPLRSPS